METLLKMFSKNGARVLDDPLKKSLQDEGYVQSLKSVYLSVPITMFAEGAYNPCLNGSMKEGNFILYK